MPVFERKFSGDGNVEKVETVAKESGVRRQSFNIRRKPVSIERVWISQLHCWHTRQVGLTGQLNLRDQLLLLHLKPHHAHYQSQVSLHRLHRRNRQHSPPRPLKLHPYHHHGTSQETSVQLPSQVNRHQNVPTNQQKRNHLQHHRASLFSELEGSTRRSLRRDLRRRKLSTPHAN